MGLKDIYTSAEDKYYGLIDKISESIPINKITDPIDSVIPSFALVIILLVLISGFFLWPVIFPAGEFSYIITVKDSDNKAMEGIKVKIFLDSKEQTLETNEDGEIKLTAIKGTEIIIEIKKTGYKEEKRTVTIDEKGQKITFKLKKLAPEGPTETTLRFSDPSGKRITGREITVKLSCRNSSVTPSPSIVKDSDKDGKITVPIPKNCEKLMVNEVEVQGYESWYGYVDSAVKTIKLELVEVENQEELIGDLKVVVQNKDAEPLNGIKVNLMKGHSIIKQAFSDSGLVQFIGIPIGTYDLSLQDSENNYAVKKVYSVRIENETVKEEIVEMKLTQKGTIKVTVKDKATNSRIKNAEVILLDELDEIIAEEGTGENGETVEFALFTDEELNLVVRHDDYLPETQLIEELPDEGEEITVEMEKITSSNSGKLNITLIDEEGKKVVNARVMLLNTNGSFASGYPEKFSDAKGEVNYTGIKEGTYLVRAEKYPASAESDSFEIILTKKTEITVTLIIGNALIKLKTINREGNPISFTRVKVKSIDEEQEFSLDEQGETELNIKADKRVHFEFYDPENEYASYTTKEYQLFPEELLPDGYEITAVMPEQISGQELWVNLKGVYFDGRKQDVLTGGKTYKAVFELFVPTNESYNNAGIHVRIGEDKHAFMENDIAWLKKINSPKSAKIKGTTWNPETGEETDFDSDNSASANAKAKWVNILWQNVKPGVYETEIEVKVKSGATEKEKIPIKYRAWGKNDSYNYFPSDNDIGTTKQRLYAETFEKVYNTEEEAPICKENNLCMSGQILLDMEEAPYITQEKLPFKTKANGLYEYNFKITNNSLSVFDEPEIWIKLINPTENNGQYVETEKAEISYYEIKRADGTEIINNELNDAATNGIELGKFQSHSVIEGKIGIKTKNAGTIYVNVLMVEKTSSGSNEIFSNEKKTGVKISSGKELQITAKPSLLPAWVKTPIEITVTDTSGLEIENALVIFSVTQGENSELEIDGKLTGRLGKAGFETLKWDPKTKIKFTAKKFGFESGEKELILSKEIFEVEPESINETLSKRDNPKITKQITIRNLLETKLKIYSIELKEETGYFELFIDLDKTNAKFSDFIGSEVEAFPQEYSREGFFIAELANSVQEDDIDSATGIITITLINTEFDARYDKEIEVTLNLGLGEEINEPNCLYIKDGQTDFSRQTTNQTVQLSYTIENVCRDSTGRLIPLNNLKARVEWKDSQKGELSLNMKGRNLELKPNFEIIASGIRAEEEMTATLTYEPDPELTGEQGATEFAVRITAEINYAGGKQEITTSPSQEITGKIGNIRLENCIIFNPAPGVGAKIEETADQAEFTVTNNCGTEVELRFCYDDSRCASGTDEGGIKVTPNTTLSPMRLEPGENNSKPVVVERMQTVPGLYGIKIDARKDVSEGFQEIAVYDVIVEPRQSDAFSLNKYEIVIPELNQPDVIELYNRQLYKNLDVKASNCVWDATNKPTDKSSLPRNILAGASAGAMAGAYVGGVIGGVIGGIIGAILGALTCVFGGCPDPCEDTTTIKMADYWINLSGGDWFEGTARNPPNLNAITLSISGVKINWATNDNYELLDYDYLFGEHGRETLPVWFEKTPETEENIRPVYGILTIDATKQNIPNKLTVPIDDAWIEYTLRDYGLPSGYYDGPTSGGGHEIMGKYNDVSNATKKFHVRAVTKRYIEEIKGTETSLDCVRTDGGVGAKGENALPKVKLDWSWNEIKWNECDQNNKDYIYCDAAQFSVMLNERMQKIEEFMKKNNYSFSCPRNPVVVQAEANTQNSTSNEIEDGKMGLKQVLIEKDEEAKKVKITGIIENKARIQLAAEFVVELISPEGITLDKTSCMEPGNVPANSTKEFSCEFDLGEDTTKFYRIKARHLRESTYNELNSSLKNYYNQYGIDIIFNLNQESQCWVQTNTEIKQGVFPLEFYLNKSNSFVGKHITQDSVKINGSTVQTDDPEIVNVINYIKDLTHFNAYLIQDGYSNDFKLDFAEYYENVSFLDTPSWFTDQNPNTTENEMSVYYNNPGLLEFTIKHRNETELPDPGLYRVDLSINYLNDRWSLFKADGEPNAEILVEFTRLKTPNPNSILYYIPFDGRIGESNLGYHRQGYGAGYENLGQEEIKINSKVNLGATLEGSIPLKEIKIEKIDSLTKMNSDQDTRGSILRMDYSDASLNSMAMQFYSTKATPVILKMTQKENPNEQAFSYYYGMTEQDSPVLAGTDRLAYWKGLGKCRSFLGAFIQNYGQWDLKTENEPEMVNWYQVKWNKAPKGGDTYLKTILYSPTERNIILKRYGKETSDLSTPDTKNSEHVKLNGIAGMQYNNANEYTTGDYLKNIQSVLDLVKEGQACIAQNNASMNVYWNEANLYRTQGTLNQSIDEFERTLEAGNNCIG